MTAKLQEKDAVKWPQKVLLEVENVLHECQKYVVVHLGQLSVAQFKFKLKFMQHGPKNNKIVSLVLKGLVECIWLCMLLESSFSASQLDEYNTAYVSCIDSHLAYDRLYLTWNLEGT